MARGPTMPYGLLVEPAGALAQNEKSGVQDRAVDASGVLRRGWDPLSCRTDHEEAAACLLGAAVLWMDRHPCWATCTIARRCQRSRRAANVRDMCGARALMRRNNAENMKSSGVV